MGDDKSDKSTRGVAQGIYVRLSVIKSAFHRNIIKIATKKSMFFTLITFCSLCFLVSWGTSSESVKRPLSPVPVTSHLDGEAPILVEKDPGRPTTNNNQAIEPVEMPNRCPKVPAICDYGVSLRSLGIALGVYRVGDRVEVRVGYCEGKRGKEVCGVAKGVTLLGRLEGPQGSLYALDLEWFEGSPQAPTCGWRGDLSGYANGRYELSVHSVWWTEGGSPWAAESSPQTCSSLYHHRISGPVIKPGPGHVSDTKEEVEGHKRSVETEKEDDATGDKGVMYEYNWLSNRWFSICQLCRLVPGAKFWSAKVKWPPQIKDAKSAHKTLNFFFKGFPHHLKNGIFLSENITSIETAPFKGEGWMSGRCGDLEEEVNLLGLSHSIDANTRFLCFRHSHILHSPLPIILDTVSPTISGKKKKFCAEGDLKGGWVPRTGRHRNFFAAIDGNVTWKEPEVPVFLPMSNGHSAKETPNDLRSAYFPVPMGLEWQGLGCRYHLLQQEKIYKCLQSNRLLGDGGLLPTAFARWFPNSVLEGDERGGGILADTQIRAGRPQTTRPIAIFSLEKFVTWGKEESADILTEKIKKRLIGLLTRVSGGGSEASSTELDRASPLVLAVTIPAAHEISWPYHTTARSREYNRALRRAVGDIYRGGQRSYRHILRVIGLDKMSESRLDTRAPYALSFANSSGGVVYSAVNVALNIICSATR